MVIVLSQTEIPSTNHRDLEEELVAILLMKDGLEVSIIGDIRTITPESTDALCLEGIRGDMLFVSWYPPKEAGELLNDAGIVGRFDDSPPPAVLPIAAPGHYDPLQRRIECLDLSQFDRPIDARRVILKSLAEIKKATDSTKSPAPQSPAKSFDTPSIKPMPKRQLDTPTNDPLDSLLDAFEDMDL